MKEEDKTKIRIAAIIFMAVVVTSAFAMFAISIVGVSVSGPTYVSAFTGVVSAGDKSVLYAKTAASDVKAGTWVEGHITEDTTWTLASSPYLVTGDIFVDEGATLTIEPGVIVKFGGYISIFVNGSLYAVGTDTDRIKFTSNKPSPEIGDWNTVKFQGARNKTFIMKYTVIEYGAHGVAISSKGGSLIENCEFYNNIKGIHIIGNSNTQIKSNTIKFNQIGISSEGKEVSDVIIVNNIIRDNSGSGIYLYVSSSSTSYIYNITVSGNAVSSNGESGIYLYAYVTHRYSNSYIYNVTISDNTVSLNSGSGIYLNAYSPSYDSPHSYIYNIIIIGNTVSSNGGPGIYLSTYSAARSLMYDVIISRNTVSFNDGPGIYLYAPYTYTFSYIYNVTINDNDVYSNNGAGIYLYDSSRSSYIYDITITNNTISSNSGSGTYLHIYSYSFLGSTSSHTYNITISGNTVSSNDNSGIYLYIPSYFSYTHDIKIKDNTVSSNDDSSIYLCAPASYYSYIYDVIISGNTISLNNGSGIRTYSTDHYTAVEFDITMHDNYIYSNDQGISISGGSKTHITNSSIHTNILGVLYDRTTGNFASLNNIYQNEWAMNVTNGATVKAEQNYWGDPSGPYHVSMNPEGKGNPVNGNGVDLDFIPFLTSPVEIGSPIASFIYSPQNPEV